jgi:hypothetical protein
MHNEELHLYSLPNITQVIKSKGEMGRSRGMHKSERMCRWKYIILKCVLTCYNGRVVNKVMKFQVPEYVGNNATSRES